MDQAQERDSQTLMRRMQKEANNLTWMSTTLIKLGNRNRGKWYIQTKSSHFRTEDLIQKETLHIAILRPIPKKLMKLNLLIDNLSINNNNKKLRFSD